MNIIYHKMDAQGNDFIILDRIGLQASHPSSEMDYKDLAIKACNRKQGIGADGLVLLEDYSEAVDDPLPSGHKPDARMKIYNSDGSLAEMCGSALRCVTSLLYKKTGLTELSILTDSGLKTCEVLFEEDREVIRVMIGRAGFIQEGLIVTLEGMDSSSGSSSVIPDPDRESSSSGVSFQGALVDVGNKHFVVYQEDISHDPHLKFGSALEYHPQFEEPVNVQFARKISHFEIELKIWERGCGATLACGTGASAAVFYGVRHFGLEHKVRVNMPGGSVTVTFDPATDVCHLSGSVTHQKTDSYVYE